MFVEKTVQRRKSGVIKAEEARRGFKKRIRGVRSFSFLSRPPRDFRVGWQGGRLDF
jgi:hypothetical protein